MKLTDRFWLWRMNYCDKHLIPLVLAGMFPSEYFYCKECEDEQRVKDAARLKRLRENR